jgi:hypothetical protein
MLSNSILTEDFENGSHDFRKSDFTPLYGLNLCVIQRICYRAEKRNAKTKKNVNAYKRLEVVAYRGVGKKNKEIVTLTGYNADDVEMLAKKSVPSGINDQKYYRWRLKFYRFFSLELVSRKRNRSA